jgi:putative NIF3 family GTP cyclohydrolase 1 type 2
VAKTHREVEVFLCGRVGVYDPPIGFDELVRRVEAAMEHPAQSWQNHDRPIGRIGFVSGGGGMTNHIQEAVENECDAYITGEKSLYTVLHARHVEIDLIVGSHTHTEFGGVRSLAEKVHAAFPDVEILPIPEGHFE